MKKVSLNLADKEYKELKKMAKKNEMRMSYLIRSAIAELIRKHREVYDKRM